jgi:glycerol-3-phosphate cytidylyltransferase
MSKVLTIGTFDMLHIGHLELFEHCRALAGDGQVIVGVNSDDFVQVFKPAPVVGQMARIKMIQAVRTVDVVRLNLSAGRELIEDVRPELLVIEEGWQPLERYYKQIDVTERWMEERRITLVWSPRTTGFSSTGLRNIVLQSQQ